MSNVFGTEKNKLKNTPQPWGPAVLGASIGASIFLLIFDVRNLITTSFFIVMIFLVFLSILIAKGIKVRWVSFVASLVLTVIRLSVTPVLYLILI